MNRRRLGRTCFDVTEISFGARWLYPSRSPKEPQTAERDEIGRQVVRAALHAGINHFDTAPGYPHSERLLGEALEGRDDVIISTKVWSDDPAVIRESVKRSQERLRRKPLDLFMLHGVQFAAGLPTMRDLKDEGEVRFIGISMGFGGADQVRPLIEAGEFDFYQLGLNILHPENLELCARCRETGAGVQIMSPLYRGVITGHPDLCTDLKAYGIETLEQAALRWLLDMDPAVVPIPGTSRPERVAHLVSAAECAPVPPDVWAAFQANLRQHPDMQVEI